MTERHKIRFKKPFSPAPVPAKPNYRPQATPFRRPQRSSATIIFLGTSFFFLTTATTAVGVKIYRQYQTALSTGVLPVSRKHKLGEQDVEWDNLSLYDTNATSFEVQLNKDEKLLRLDRIRKKATRECKGSVLEVCAGTGRNIPYYDLSLTESITFLDHSPSMLSIAREKWRDRIQSEKTFPQATFLPLKLSTMPIPAENNQFYTTVIQTNGLCSVSNPISHLRQLQRLCHPSRGRIILVEHGESSWSWLNFILDIYWPEHKNRWGCIWNRDIEGIIKGSGMIVEQVERIHFGTEWIIYGRPGAWLWKEDSGKTEFEDKVSSYDDSLPRKV